LQNVLTLETVACGEWFTVSVVTCRDDHTRWSAPEVREGYELVLPRHGRFRRKADGQVHDIDPTMGYFGVPGVEQQFAHPVGGDVCTLIQFTNVPWATANTSAVFRMTSRAQLIHRRILTGDGDGEEALVNLIANVEDAPTGAGDALVAAARDAVLADLPEARSLLKLAALLGVSPYRLSRSFSRTTGQSYTAYRNQVRLNRLLDRLAQGETRLGTLAADLGFADQAHMTRTVRRHFAQAPNVLRRLLTPRDG
jgi:AraC-like DNA-binding protein